jgi:hypothetical protein
VVVRGRMGCRGGGREVDGGGGKGWGERLCRWVGSYRVCMYGKWWVSEVIGMMVTEDTVCTVVRDSICWETCENFR